ncbi:MAG: type II 3-dehydroquinate dehydratase [Methylotenera sp.]
MTSKSVLVLHGPNLNLLGLREPEHYGNLTLADIDANLLALAKQANIALETYQSNAEAEIVAKIQSLASPSSTSHKVDFIIINPAAFTHTSISIRDAISAVKIPFIEVHLSNVFARESFRHHSYFSDVAVGVISGLGAEGYYAALQFAINKLNNSIN